MRPLIKVLVCALCIAPLADSGVARPGSSQREAISQSLQQTLSAIAAKHKIPGMAVAYIRRGAPTVIAVIGFRDTPAGAPINRNTVFEAGSLGEPVYAYGVLTLVAERQLDLGIPLTKYLPLPYLRDTDALAESSPTEPIYDPRFNQITALSILDHTGGMPDWARNEHFRLQFTPGQQWSYSNEGYVYLQHVVEHVTGDPPELFLARTVLGPLGKPEPRSVAGVVAIRRATREAGSGRHASSTGWCASSPSQRALSASLGAAVAFRPRGQSRGLLTPRIPHPHPG